MYTRYFSKLQKNTYGETEYGILVIPHPVATGCGTGSVEILEGLSCAIYLVELATNAILEERGLIYPNPHTKNSLGSCMKE